MTPNAFHVWTGLCCYCSAGVLTVNTSLSHRSCIDLGGVRESREGSLLLYSPNNGTKTWRLHKQVSHYFLKYFLIFHNPMTLHKLKINACEHFLGSKVFVLRLSVPRERAIKLAGDHLHGAHIAPSLVVVPLVRGQRTGPSCAFG